MIESSCPFRAAKNCSRIGMYPTDWSIRSTAFTLALGLSEESNAPRNLSVSPSSKTRLWSVLSVKPGDTNMQGLSRPPIRDPRQLRLQSLRSDRKDQAVKGFWRRRPTPIDQEAADRDPNPSLVLFQWRANPVLEIWPHLRKFSPTRRIRAYCSIGIAQEELPPGGQGKQVFVWARRRHVQVRRLSERCKLPGILEGPGNSLPGYTS